MSFVLTIDDRERAVLPFIANKNIPYIIQRITTGDYAISRDDIILAIFERKTLIDFAQSFVDGRYLNYNKMKEIQDLYPGCQLFYIIEDQHSFPADETKFSRIPYKYIAAGINRLEIVEGIQTIKTKDADHTASALANKLLGYEEYWPVIEHRYPKSDPPKLPMEFTIVCKTVIDNPSISYQDLITKCGTETCLKASEYPKSKNLLISDFVSALMVEVPDEPTQQLIELINQTYDQWRPIIARTGSLQINRHKSPGEIALNMWMCIPGVAIMTAPILINVFSIADLINGVIPRQQLEKLRNTKGNGLHRSLIDKLTTPPDQTIELKILKCIPGIGQKADGLLAQFRLKQVIAMTKADLEVVRINGRNLGPAKTQEILESINHKGNKDSSFLNLSK